MKKQDISVLLIASGTANVLQARENANLKSQLEDKELELIVAQEMTVQSAEKAAVLEIENQSLKAERDCAAHNRSILNGSSSRLRREARVLRRQLAKKERENQVLREALLAARLTQAQSNEDF